MKQGIIKGLLMVSIMGSLFTACSKEDPDPNGLKENSLFYSFPEAEPGTTLYDGPEGKVKPFEAQWVVNNQVVGNTRVVFGWSIPVTNHVMVQSYPNETVLDWLINASGKNPPVIKDAEWGDYYFEYKGQSGLYQYYELSDEFHEVLGGKGHEYAIFINDEHYCVLYTFTEPPTAIYDRTNEVFTMHLKFSSVTLIKDRSNRELTVHQFDPIMEMTLVTTKSLPYSY